MFALCSFGKEYVCSLALLKYDFVFGVEFHLIISVHIYIYFYFLFFCSCSSSDAVIFSHIRRYHEDGENKFGHFQPGKLSENLRYALGLRPNQLPIFVYRMRVLGYPPGWLRDAEVHQADMKLYDATGKCK